MNKIWRWLLFLAAITGLIANVAGLRATSLIFGRGPPSANGTSTTTTTNAPALGDAANLNSSTIDDEYIQPNEEEGGVTRPPLTGIPQIDYVWDPNLPRELNGYNLSTYPFLSLVPDAEDIDFKCDGLHDGFYASLKYSCQLYHHCIYGIRHDFLCANFTAFDQKTFICQFVSEVNCKASPKYFFRNDALYVALTTTSTTTTTIAPPITQAPQIYERPRPRRPLLRRRPQPADYYEEEYEDDYIDTRPARRRQPQVRARTRRPEYDDYESQGQGRRFSDDTYADRRPSRNRDPIYDDTDEEIDEPIRPRNRNSGGNRRTKGDPDRRRNQSADRDTQRPLANDRRPKPQGKRNTEKRPKPKPQRYDDEEEYAEYEERSFSSGNRFQEPENDAPKVIPTGGGSALFSKPRAPPRINRPVPINDKTKFEYTPKVVKTTTSLPAVEPEPADYEDDYEEPAESVEPVEVQQPRRPNLKKKPLPKPKQPDYQQEEEDELDGDLAPVVAPRNNYRQTTSRNIQKRPSRIETRSNKPAQIYAEDNAEEEDDTVVPTPRNKLRPGLLRNRASTQQQRLEEGRASQRRPVLENYSAEDDLEEVPSPIQAKPIGSQRPQLHRLKNVARPSNAPPAIAPLNNAPSNNAPSNNAPSNNAPPNNAQTNSAPQSESRFNVAQSDVRLNAPQSDGRSNRRPDQNLRPVPEVSSNKFRNSFRFNPRDNFGSTTTTTTTTTPAPSSEPPALYEDEEYEDEEFDEASPPEPLSSLPPRPLLSVNTPENQYTQNSSHRFATNTNQERPLPNQSSIKPPQDTSKENDDHNSQESFESGEQPSTQAAPIREARPIVRVIKRPFLPSRGGNPYLPRGLKPLGPVEHNSAESSEQTILPTTGARLTEFHPPLVSHDYEPDREFTTTTEAPRFDDLNPREKLEEILSSDLDVTLNDALNPTLKPLSRSSPIGFSFKYDPSYYEQPIDRSDVQVPKLNIRGSTSYYTEQHQQHPRSVPSAPANTGPSTDFYTDYEY